MRPTDVLEALTALAVLAATVFEVRQLVHYPRDRALRVLVPGLVLLSFTLLASVPIWPLTVLDDFQDGVTGMGNVIWMTMSWCYAAFFLFADRARDEALRRRLVYLTLAALVICIIVHLVSRFTAPPGSLEPGTVRAAIRQLSVYGYALVVYALGTAWAATYLRRLSHRWLRAAVRLVIIGAGAMTLGVDLITLARELVLYVLFPGSRYPWASDLYNVGRLGGQFLLATGLLLAPAAALLVGARQWHDHTRQSGYSQTLEPLWQRLTAEFPEVVLRSDRLDGSFARRTAEITDALSKLAPYVPLADRADSALPQASETAKMMTAALDARDQARQRGDLEDAWHEGPYPVMEPDLGNDWKRRAGWMQTLSDELDHLRATRGRRQVSEEPAG